MKKTTQQAMPVVVPLTIEAWRSKINDLQAGLGDAEQLLAQRRAARRLAAGKALLAGGEGEEDVQALMDQERESEDRVDVLKSAIAIAQSELAKLEAQEAAKLEATRRDQREQLIAQIHNAAEAVDRGFAQAGEGLETVTQLLAQFAAAGGHAPGIMHLRGIITRSALNGGLRGKLQLDSGCSRNAWAPLADSLKLFV
ncbi:MAG: hypothetical protein WCB12_01290 [Bryobacteraceae bacterium]